MASSAVGARVAVHVYFNVREHTDESYKFLLAMWPIDRATWKPSDPAPPAKMARSELRTTADGLFPSDHWQAGQHIRDRFSLTVPSDWHGDAVAVGLVAVEPKGGKATATGAAPSNDADLLVLGTLPFVGSLGPPGP